MLKKKPEAKRKKAKKPKKTAVNHLILNKESSENARWYVVHSYSGHENKAANQMKQKVLTMGLDDKVFEILVPTQNKVVIRRGKKEDIKEKLFPGYLLVKMELTDDSWLAVRTTPGITGFVGIGNKPTPLLASEAEAIQKFTKLKAPKFKASFSLGEAVKIIDGPFSEFLGSVESIDDAKGKVRVLVSIFDRETPVELDFLQVSKI